jgi:hypothetical protein
MQTRNEEKMALLEITRAPACRWKLKSATEREAQQGGTREWRGGDEMHMLMNMRHRTSTEAKKRQGIRED